MTVAMVWIALGAACGPVWAQPKAAAKTKATALQAKTAEESTLINPKP